MATVTKRISHKTNQITYQVKIRMKGFPPVTETFKGKTEADKWAKLTEAKMIEGKHFPHAQAKKHTLSELIDAYLNSLKAANARRFIDVSYSCEWRLDRPWLRSTFLLILVWIRWGLRVSASGNSFK